jgi:hypothetical protein
MKKILLSALLMAACFMGYSQDNARPVKQDGNVFSTTTTVKSTVKGPGDPKYIPTAYKWKDSKGNIFTIYLHTVTRGDNAGQTFCYIWRVPESGKGYWQKIPVEPARLKGGSNE